MATRSDYGWAESAVTFWATVTLAVMAVASLLLRYVTDPVSCFLPAQFEPSQVAYATQTCFLSHHISTVQPSTIDETRGEPQFTYHQWIPFFLGACALLCLLPHFLWRIFSAFLWLDTHTLMQAIARNQNSENRHVMSRDLAQLLQAGLKAGNSVLTLAAMGRKALMAAVCFVELILMARVFDPQLTLTKETEQMDDHHGDENVSIPLPVTTFFCRFEIRRMQNVQDYEFQCFMPNAQVYSKGLAFLFYLFLVLFVLCALDMAVWAGRLLVPGLRDVSLRRYLAVNQSENDSDSGSENSFLESLGPDGMLILAMAGDRCGPMAAMDLTYHLWAVFKANGFAPSPVNIGPAPRTTAESVGVTPGSVEMVTIPHKDGGDSLAAHGEKEKPR